MEEVRQPEPRVAVIAALNAAVRGYQRATDAVDEAAAQQFGINRTDLRCLDLLFDGPMSAGRLAEAINLSPAAMTALIDRLERKGYVRRVRDPADRRRVLVELTEQARVQAWQIYGPIAEEGDAGLARYTDEQLRLISNFLHEGQALAERHLERMSAQQSDPRSH